MIYLSGPMSGKPNFNKEEFDKVTASLRNAGHEVLNPAELDSAMPADATWNDFLARDIHLLLSDRRLTDIAMLPDWGKSRGATLELEAARRKGMGAWKVVYHPDGMIGLKTLEVESVLREKPAQTAGHKDIGLRTDLIPVFPMMELALTYTLGSRKYADRNWEKGLPWSKCYAAALRHLFRWWAGEQRDKDGQHHLGSVAWHALALIEFELTHPELDNRQKMSEEMRQAMLKLIDSAIVPDRGETKNE